MPSEVRTRFVDFRLFCPLVLFHVHHYRVLRKKWVYLIRAQGLCYSVYTLLICLLLCAHGNVFRKCAATSVQRISATKMPFLVCLCVSRLLSCFPTIGKSRLVENDCVVCHVFCWQTLVWQTLVSVLCEC